MTLDKIEARDAPTDGREPRKMEEALFLVAPHHQGGHSEAGQRVAAALGVRWPFKMDDLASVAESRGYDRQQLWPWCYGRRRYQAQQVRS